MKRGKKNTKVYTPNFLSYALHDDLRHLKVWKQRIQENKDVQQKRQIDKILQGVIKQRMFGDVISKEVKDSPTCFYTIDQISKSQIHSSGNLSKSSRSRASSIMTLQKNHHLLNKKKSQNFSFCQRFQAHQHKNDQHIMMSYTPRKRQKQIKLPLLFSPQTNPIQIQHLNQNSQHLQHKSESFKSQRKLKYFDLNKAKTFHQYFRHLSDNFTTPIIFDIKITRQKLLEKGKLKIPQDLFEKFLRFFGFPQSLSFKQYSNWLEKTVSTDLKLINYFTYTILDESSNGFLTLSDLFKLMQTFPQNKQIEEEVFFIQKQIQKIIKQLQLKEREERMFKPTTQQTVISNHNLNLDDVKHLLKQTPTHQLVKSSVPRASIYQKSILALQHDVNIRLKQDQIEQEQVNNINKKKGKQKEKEKKTTISPNKNMLYQEGMKFSEFIKLYKDKRPKLFCLFIGVLTGQKESEYQ